MQTEESVRIRKSDLESWKTVEGMDPEQMPAPEEVKPKELMDLTSSNGAKPGVDGTPPPLGSVLAEAKDNLEKFIESLHKKAAQAMSWVTSLEPPALENPTVKQKAPLGSYVVANFPTSLLFAIFLSMCVLLVVLCSLRFSEDVQKTIGTLEDCFLQLAECQHMLEANGKTTEFFGWV